MLLVLWLGLASGAGTIALHAQVSVEKEDYEYARRLYNDRLFEIAGGQFLSFVDRYPNSPFAAECLFLAGESWRQAGKLQRAASVYSRVIVEYPNSPYVADALFALASVHEATGDLSSAALSLERVPLLAPQSPRTAEAYLKAGVLHRRAGNLVESALNLQRCLEDPRGEGLRDQARLELARTRLAQGRTDLAISLLNEFTNRQRIDSLTACGLLELAAVEAKVLNFDRADELYGKVQGSASSGSLKYQALLGRARTAADRGDWHHTEGWSREVLKDVSVPDSVRWRARCLLATALARQGMEEQALKTLDGQLSGLPPAGKKSVLLARLLVAEALRDGKAIQSSGNELLELATSDSAGQQWTALSLVYLLRHSAEPEVVTKALELARRWPQADSALGLTALVAQSLAQMPGGRVRAEALLSDFLLRHPTSPHADDAQYALARMLLREGRTAQAWEELIRFLRSFPESEWEEEARALLDSLRVTVPMPSPAALGLSVRTALALASGQALQGRLLQMAEVALDVAKDYGLAAALAKKAMDGSPNPEEFRRASRLLADAHLMQSLACQLTGESRLGAGYADSARIVLERLRGAEPGLFDCEMRARYARAIVRGSADAFTKLDALTQLAQAGGDSGVDSSCLEVLWTFAATLWEASDRGRNKSVASRAGSLAEIASKSGEDSLASEALGLAIQAALAVGDTAKGMQLMARYLDRFGPNASRWGWVAVQYSRALAGQGEFERAARLLSQVVRSRSYSALAEEARTELGRCLVRMRRYDEALEVLRRQWTPLPADLWEPGIGLLFPVATVSCSRALAEAEALASLNRRREAVQVLAQARANLREADTDCLSSLLTQEATLLTGAGNWLGACFVLEQLYSNPSLPASSRERAGAEWLRLLFEHGDYAKAMDLGERLWSESQNRDVARQAAEVAIVAAFRLDRAEKARAWATRFEQQFGKGREIAEPRARFLLEEGEFYFRQKDFDKALKAFERAANDFRQTEWGRRAEFAIAKTHLTLNHTDKALEILTNLPQKYPNSEVARLAYLNLGVFYHQNKQLGNAILALGQVVDDSLRAEPSTLQSALRELIRCLDEAGMWDRELALLRYYIRRFPEAEDLFDRQVQVGTALLRLNEYDQAIGHLKRLLPQADKETKAEVQYWIGKAYLSKGDLETGIAEMLKVKYACPPTELPWDVTALFEAGLAYMRLGEWDRAESLFQQVVKERGSGSNFGRSALQRIQEIQSLRKGARARVL
jgi:TolA-binding protein